MTRAASPTVRGEARDRPGGDITDHAEIGGTVFTQVCGADGKSVHRGVVEYGEVVGSGNVLREDTARAVAQRKGLN